MSIVQRLESPLWETNYDQWVNNIRNLLRNEILPKITSNANIIEQLLSDVAMATWIAVFTHQNVNSEEGKNYETWEKIGDNVMYVQFFAKLIESVPGITPARLNDMGNFYLSKDYQGKFSFEKGWHRYLRTNFVPTLDDAEDLVEALFGALYYIGNSYIKMGLGDVLAKQFMLYFFQGIDINLNIPKPKETIVKEIFKDHLKLREPRLVVDEQDDINPYTASLIINDEAKNYFNNIFSRYNNENPNQKIALFINVLATAKSTSKIRATKEVYEKAVEILFAHGITDTWAKETKNNINATNSGDPELYLAAYQKAARDGFKNIDFINERRRKPYKYLTLAGFYPNGKYKILADIQTKDISNADMRKLLLKKYLGQQLSGYPIVTE